MNFFVLDAIRSRIKHVGKRFVEQRNKFFEDLGDGVVHVGVMYWMQVVDVTFDSDLAVIVDTKLRW